MEWLQTAQNPWGQEVLVRISWNLFWAALIVGAIFMVVHLVLRRFMAQHATSDSGAVSSAVAGVPERIVRHGLTARLFHWVMAASMLVLLFTGFLPQIGLQFSWVTIHWVAGVVLIACIVFHIVHATFFQSLRNVWISVRDIKEWFQELSHSLGRRADSAPKPGKYPMDHKLFHHTVTLAGLVAMVTGALMMFRVETPFWTRNPYMYTDATWGWIYVLHGLSGVVLVFMTIAHIYFAILPEKRWLTMSMIFGWIGKKQYLEHHDPERWSPTGATEES